MRKLICFLPGPSFLIPGLGHSEFGSSKWKTLFRQMKSANLCPRAVTMNAGAGEITGTVFMNFIMVKLSWRCVPPAQEAKQS